MFQIQFGAAEVEILIKLVLAALFGLIIGFERRARNYGLGSRTSMLVCIGACLFTIGATYGGDVTGLGRVAQGLATGVGFIGAAIIWRQPQNPVVVHGLTSAVAVWVLTAIGFALGAGAYAAAVLVTFGVLIILLVRHFKYKYG
ncbi:MAG: MgtC/SapB family protein [Candidatus Pacearchaeota archaeon]|nr:MgtC/SapB family protein [Candidatus Pacearchaeota archaeon]